MKPKYTQEDCIAEIQRELAMRSTTYPRLINQGKMNHETARYRIRCFQKALDLLEERKPDTTLPFSQVIAEIRREIAMRRNLYPKWILQGRIHRLTAEKQIAVLQRTVEILCGPDITVSDPSQMKMF